VTPDVLIPRPETEILVEVVLGIIKDLRCRPLDILDLGTGSGNIAISLTKESKVSRMVASDVSEEALCVARKNAALNNVSERIRFARSGLFDNIKDSFDIIISNPPYVAAEEFSSLPKEVLAEPRIALDGGIRGTEILAAIIEEAPFHLNREGYLILEIGYGQSGAVRRLLDSSKTLGLQFIKKDYAGIERIVVAKKIERITRV